MSTKIRQYASASAGNNGSPYPDFSSLTWNEIKQAANHIASLTSSDYDEDTVYQQFMYYARFGKMKYITVSRNGTKQVPYKVWGINQKTLASGTGKAGLTFGPDYRAVSFNDSNVIKGSRGSGNYSSCDARTALNSGGIWNGFPTDVTNNIVEVQNTHWGTSNVETTTDKIWLPAFGDFWDYGADSRPYTNVKEQFSLLDILSDVYITSDDNTNTLYNYLALMLGDGNTSPYYFWFRDCYTTTSKPYYGYTINYNVSYGNPTYTYFFPCFFCF